LINFLRAAASFWSEIFTYLQDYQGRESRVVIISCVRSSRRFLKDDLGKGVGLMFERKRYYLGLFLSPYLNIKWMVAE
jgi:hypothetical protein